MGIYYQPPLANIGAQQPLTPAKLTPPVSGPIADNPIFGAASLASTIVAAWLIAASPQPLRAGLVPSAASFVPPPSTALTAIGLAWAALGYVLPQRGGGFAPVILSRHERVHEMTHRTSRPAPGVDLRYPGRI